MKNRSVTLSLLTATLFAIPAFAADEARPDGPPPGGPRGKMRAEIMQRFDQDKDGQLNETERAEAQKAREEMRQKWAAQGEQRRAELKKKFDKNNDGQLDEAERQAAREEMRGHWAGRGGPRHFRGAHGGAGEPPMWMRRELHRWFEQKWGSHPGHRGGPGRLHHGHGGPRPGLRAALVKRFDQDHDGKLNETERAEARKAGEEMRAKAQQHRKDVLSKFDRDGDGRLGETERNDMRAAWEKFLQQQPAAAKPAN